MRMRHFRAKTTFLWHKLLATFLSTLTLLLPIREELLNLCKTKRIMYYSEPIQLEYNFITRSCETRCQLPTHWFQNAHISVMYSSARLLVRMRNTTFRRWTRADRCDGLRALAMRLISTSFFSFATFLLISFRAWSVIKSVACLQMTISTRFKNRTRKKEKPHREKIWPKKKLKIIRKNCRRVLANANRAREIVCSCELNWEQCMCVCATVTEMGERGD